MRHWILDFSAENGRADMNQFEGYLTVEPSIDDIVVFSMIVESEPVSGTFSPYPESVIIPGFNAIIPGAHSESTVLAPWITHPLRDQLGWVTFQVDGGTDAEGFIRPEAITTISFRQEFYRRISPIDPFRADFDLLVPDGFTFRLGQTQAHGISGSEVHSEPSWTYHYLSMSEIFDPGIHIIGSDGGDVLIGRDGNDTIEGAAGNDTLIGGGGTNELIGGEGEDYYYVTDGSVIVEPDNGEAFVFVGSDGTQFSPGLVTTVSEPMGIRVTVSANADGTGETVSFLLKTELPLEQIAFLEADLPNGDVGYRVDTTPNTAPIAVEDFFDEPWVNHDGTFANYGNVLENDSDPESDALNVVAQEIVTEHFTVTLSDTGLVQVSGALPASSQTYAYTVVDARGLTAESTFTLAPVIPDVIISRDRGADYYNEITLFEGETEEFTFNLEYPIYQDIEIIVSVQHDGWEDDLVVHGGTIPAGKTSVTIPIVSALVSEQTEVTRLSGVAIEAILNDENIDLTFNGDERIFQSFDLEVMDRVLSADFDSERNAEIEIAHRIKTAFFEGLSEMLGAVKANGADPVDVSAAGRWVNKIAAGVGFTIDAGDAIVDFGDRMVASLDIADETERLDFQYQIVRQFLVDVGDVAARTAFSVGVGIAGSAGLAAATGGTSLAYTTFVAQTLIGWAGSEVYDELFKDAVRDGLGEAFSVFVTKDTFREFWQAGATESDTETVLPIEGTATASENVENILLGNTRATVLGTLEDLNGDSIFGFSEDDTLEFLSPGISADDISVDEGSLIIHIDEDGDGIADHSVTLEGDFDTETVSVNRLTDRTILSLAGEGVPVPVTPAVPGFLEVGSAAADQIPGNSGNDTLRGMGGNDTLDGLAGDDELDGGTGNDFVAGGSDNDLLAGSEGNDTLLGGEGSDTLNGGDGQDRLNGQDGDDVIIGGRSTADLRDIIYAGDGNDSVDAGYGNDQVFGQGGNDTISGGFGVDEVFGQDGDDVLTGSAYSDLIFGGSGNDFVNGGFGSDRTNGGTGSDKFFHVGIAGHGSDWVQDYSAAEGDVLLFGVGSATADQFQINFAHTISAEGVSSGDPGIREAFVIYRPTEQIIWALIDGEDQSSINLQIAGSDALFDLLL